MGRAERRRRGQRGPLPPERRGLDVPLLDVLTNYGAIMPLLRAFRAGALLAQQAQGTPDERSER